MQTWFDRLRGSSQGRVVPALTPPGGSRVFVLGEEAPEEQAELTAGDHTEVKQIVDLTDFDFLTATMDTIGRVSGTALTPPTWANDSAELFKFYFDAPVISAFNEIVPGGFSKGFTFDSVGPILYPFESYSGADSFCRAIPANTIVPAHLIGTHTPPVATPLSLLSEYTLQVWVNFDVDSHVSSWGTDFELLRFYGESGLDKWGITLTMLGLTGGGAHQWYPFLTHYDTAAAFGVSMDNLYTIDTNQGWQMLTVTFDAGLAPSARVRMYLNSTNLGNPTFSMTTTPAIPPSGAPTLQYGDMNFWGQFDSCRLLDKVLTPSEVSDSYTEMITPGPTLNTQWLQQILIDGEVYAIRPLRAGESRRWTDFIAPVRRLTGQHEVAFRMEIQEV